MRRTTILIAVCVVALAGCGGSGGSGRPKVNVPGGANPGDVQVISSWVDALRAGHVQQAASYFKLPSLVQNGTPTISLRTTQDVIGFNDSLPCGAVLLSATNSGRFIAATFRLTDRPGGSCGGGAGATARTAFVIDHGKISEWRRLPDLQGAPQGRIV